MLIRLGKFGELYMGREIVTEEITEEVLYRMPHCDTKILHAPGECHHCNLYPEYQRYRQVAGINFTGESNANKAPCPSLWNRTAEQRDNWEGNKAQ